MRFVDVALPVPLRRVFTYRVGSESVRVGQRVAAPFHGRKLPGIVVELHDREPTFTTRELLGVLEEEPVFGDELARFLREAADYYLHPLGEVLRAAAPALRAEAVKALKQRGALKDLAELRGSRVKSHVVEIATRTAVPLPDRLGPKQREALAILEARGSVRLDEIEALAAGARAVVRGLAKRGVVAITAREEVLDPFFERAVEPDAPPTLTDEQRVAREAIAEAIVARRAETFLLHGVTGAGKTEVYLHAIADAKERGLGALLLVPEIALTPQLVGRFRARFGDAIAVLHSGLGERERTIAWRALRAGTVTLAVGARSALFAPVDKLGVLVVDEEHDGSYKQEEGFRYHARDMAVLRAKRAGAVCVLGSATPSLESFHHAQRGSYTLLTLTKRATERALPRVEIIDLSCTGPGPARDPLLTLPLHRALEQTLEAGDQAILFLNRRGFSPTLRCTSCGTVAMCPACSVALTEHRRAGLLRCHYCDFATPLGSPCGACGAPDLEPIGLGTEKVEAALESVFPSARIARLDRDVASGAGVEEVLDRVRRHEVDVLVGTQMVTKGHDLPGVTLVGVLLADQSLAFPDFRAAERTFQLLTQVAGRAGRGGKEGRVILQTYQPTQPAIVLATHHDYLAFAADELAKRKELEYAPFGRLVAVRIDAPDEKQAEQTADRLAEAARATPAVERGEVEVLGPAAAPIARVRARFRFRILLKGRDRAKLRSVALVLLAKIDEGLGTARASIDVDPVSML